MADHSVARGGLGLTSKWADGDGAAGDTYTAKMNANWDKLDAWLSSIKDKDLTAPPGSPAEGDGYIVAGPTPTGAWASHAKDVAVYRDAAWAFYTPKEGDHFWVNDENLIYVFDGANWTAYAPFVSGPSTTKYLEFPVTMFDPSQPLHSVGGVPCYRTISMGGSSPTAAYLLFVVPGDYTATTGWEVEFTITGGAGTGLDWKVGFAEYVDGLAFNSLSFTEGALSTITGPAATETLKIGSVTTPSFTLAPGKRIWLKVTRYGDSDANSFACNFISARMIYT